MCTFNTVKHIRFEALPVLYVLHQPKQTHQHTHNSCHNNEKQTVVTSIWRVLQCVRKSDNNGMLLHLQNMTETIYKLILLKK